jgi:hypothetical protein
VSVLSGTAAAVLPAACGYLVWRHIGGSGSRAERLAYAVPLSIVLVVLSMLLLLHVAGRYTLTGVFVLLAIITTAAQRRRAPDPTPVPATRIAWTGWAALVVIVAEAGLVLAGVAASPTFADWDAWAIWGMKAKAFFADQGVGGYLGHADAYEFSWPARPCLTALYQAFLYSGLGGMDEGAARLLHAALWASLLLAFHGNLRRRLGPDGALLWTAVLATVPNVTYQASAGVGNLALGVYLFALLSSLESAERRPLALVGPALLLCGAFHARDEGLVLGSLALACALLVDPAARWGLDWRRGAAPFVGLLLAAGALYALWYGLVRPYHIWDIRSMWFERDVPARLIRHRHEILPILGAVGAELAVPQEQTLASPLEHSLGVALLWPLFALACLALVLGRRWRSDPTALRCALLAWGGLLVYTLGFILFPYQDFNDIANNWIYVLDRHAVALVPLAVRTAAGAFAPTAAPDV